MAEVTDAVTNAEDRLGRLRDTSGVPGEPDPRWVDDWLRRSYLDYWSSKTASSSFRNDSESSTRHARAVKGFGPVVRLVYANPFATPGPVESAVDGRVCYWRMDVAMCRGDRLVADFVAGTDARPCVPEVLENHLTITIDGTWVVWAHKLARPQGDLFIPLTGGPGYPADARAQCRNREVRGNHDAPDPLCTCGFHAVSNYTLPALPVSRGFAVLTVALSGRVLAYEWPGDGVLWRAERQTVVRVDAPTPPGGTALVTATRRHPGDPDSRPAAVSAVPPTDSGPVRLTLPVSSPLLPVCNDDAGWCCASRTLEHSPASVVLTDRELSDRALRAAQRGRTRPPLTVAA